MQPFSHRYLTREECISNYHLSRGWSVVEKGFGILANMVRCLLTTLMVMPGTAIHIVKACLCLHNIMHMCYPNLQNADLDLEDQQHNLPPGAWRDAAVMQEIEAGGRGPRQTAEGRRQRIYLMKYFNSPAGSVPWQDQGIDR